MMLCAKEIKIAYEVGSAFSLKDDELRQMVRNERLKLEASSV